MMLPARHGHASAAVDAQGRLVDSVTRPGAVWGVTVAGDMASPRRGRHHPLVPLRQRRVAGAGGAVRACRDAALGDVDAEGLFDHAPNGGRNWSALHLNGRRNETPEWASFQQAYRALYAPRAVGRRSRRLCAGAGEAGAARRGAARIGGCRRWRRPRFGGGRAECRPWPGMRAPCRRARRRCALASPRPIAARLRPLDVLVNDRIAARAEPPPARRASRWRSTRDQPHRGAALCERRPVVRRRPRAATARPGEPEAPPAAGRLVVLAVGVNEYALPELTCASPRPMRGRWARRCGPAGRGCSAMSMCASSGPPRDAEGILEALAAVARDTGRRHLRAVHGRPRHRRAAGNRFLFLPSEVRDTSSFAALRQVALDDSTLVAALARIRARDAFILLDTCYAGQVDIDQLAAIGNDTGRFLLAASSSVQEALDSYDDRNGVFAYALMEGLHGRAAVDAEGRVTALALGEWVQRRVPQLAREKGHQQNAVFRAAQRDCALPDRGGLPLVSCAEIQRTERKAATKTRAVRRTIVGLEQDTGRFASGGNRLIGGGAPIRRCPLALARSYGGAPCQGVPVDLRHRKQRRRRLAFARERQSILPESGMRTWHLRHPRACRTAQRACGASTRHAQTASSPSTRSRCGQGC